MADNSAMNDYVTSAIRTVVPIIIGAVVSFLLRHGVNVDQAEVTAWLTPACISGYYLVVRWVEQKVPKAGWLLGVAKKPGYPAQPAA